MMRMVNEYSEITKTNTIVEPHTMMIILQVRESCSTNHHHTLSTHVAVKASFIHITVALRTEASVLRCKWLRLQVTRLIMLHM